MSAANARANLRSLLTGPDRLFVASTFDAISTRMAVALGYRTGILAGSVASYSVLGAPDIVLLTLSELVEQARRICRAAPDFPLIVDADHGYGNALNVRRTIKDLEAAGVSGITIEDTDLPQPVGQGAKAGVISLEAGIGKIEAALDARHDPATVIIARTSAAGLVSPEEALKRCKAYSELGADALFLSGVPSLNALRMIGDAVNCPIVLSTDKVELKENSPANVKLVLGGHKPYQAAIAALYDAMASEAVARGLRPDDDGSPKDAKGLLHRFSLAHDYGEARARFVK